MTGRGGLTAAPPRLRYTWRRRTPAPAGPCKESVLDAQPQTPGADRPPVLPNGLPPSFHLLAKPTGSTCNLDCAYCFFLEKERLYPDAQGAHERRDARAATSASSSSRTARPRSTIAWQGGEPTLMGLEFFRRAVELGKKYARPGMTVHPHHPDQRHQDQRRLGPVLRRERLPRGPQHRRPARAARRLPARQGGQADVRQGDARPRGAARARRRVERAHHRQRRQRGRTRPRSTASCATSAAASSCSSSPSSSGRARTACRTAPRSPTGRSRPKAGAAFLIGVFEEWVRRDVGAVFVQLFDVALANWYGEPSGLCVHTASCGTALAMEFNGDVYACDHFVEPEYLRGNIHDTAPRGPARRAADAGPLRRRQAEGAAALLPRVRRALRLPRRLPQGPLRAARRTGSRGSTTSAPATRTSSTTSTRR